MSTSEPSPAPETQDARITGTIEHVTFHNAENGFLVVKLRVPGQRTAITLVGHAPSIVRGEQVDAIGEWTTDRTHGLQFRARQLMTKPPTAGEAVARYLGSGMVPGIGPALARRIVEKFGPKAIEVIEKEPMRLLDVPGIGKAAAQRIARGWNDQKALRDLLEFLAERGVPTVHAMRIHKQFGAKAREVVESDPFRLAREVRGIDFTGADAIAQRFGLDTTAPARLRAGLSHALEDAASDGHTGLPLADLIPRAAKLLAVDEDTVAEAVAGAKESGEVVEAEVEGVTCLFSRRLAEAESFIAERLAVLREGKPAWSDVNLDKAAKDFERRAKVSLSASQREALALVATGKVSVVTGGPGVGKTTILDALLGLVGGNRRIALAAPTGRAARRMSDQTGREAKTIHRLLEIDAATGDFRRAASNPLEVDLVVIDEASMVDTGLMAALVAAIPDEAALILVGDVDQLPSVGPGQVLGDIIASQTVPVARLTEIHRQAKSSRIVVNAHRINHGELPETTPAGETGDFYIIPMSSPEDGIAKLKEVVSRRIPGRFGFDPMREVQVLTPMQKGPLGARNLNVELAGLLNPRAGTRIERGGLSYGVGDRVMQVENDYDHDVFNGDMGRIVSIDREDDEIVVDFDGRVVTYSSNGLDALAPAYAVTIHKAQGSEYPAIVIPLSGQHYPMLARNLIYTAVTRARQLVVLIAEPRALEIAVSGRNARRRWTRLQALLTGNTGNAEQETAAT
ncbi:Exodeoxyribonuclease V alpha chain [Hartmannibacter diazotrophicus]|uniref:ATP-dependent RecD2 DNA helicase n=1 Tax=Hartmannibacter diazotrophicus TaxID=1482074 RepID=A0A2C9D175_9HYPH|nr:ATP-dependent RecD-like DNA helicase [Hartmannibacter diazotrophicus]SON54072.1 Exodeoxyribonuclease V alpha chain [Hartmannibacter diazotrophicus]